MSDSAECVALPLNVKQLRWLGKSVSNDTLRIAFTKILITHYRGSIWAITTDARRMHLLNLGHSSEASRRDICLIDWRRLMLEIGYHNTKHNWVLRIKTNPVTLETEKVTLGNSNIADEAISQRCVDECVTDAKGECIFPPFDANVPSENLLTTTGVFIECEFMAVNAKFIADAAAVSESKRVTFRPQSLASARTAFVIQSAAGNVWDCDWFAVIMPMAVDNAVPRPKRQK